VFRGDVADWVLSDFDALERAALPDVIGRAVDATFLFNAPAIQLVIADRGSDGTFLALPLVAGSTTMLVRGERVPPRDLPLPEGVDPRSPLAKMQLTFARGGEVLLVRDPATNLALWRVESSFADRPLGTSSPLVGLDDFPVGRPPSVLTAGDGFLGDVQFMERGRRVIASADGGRLHFLEHAARTGTVGDLVTVPTPPQAGPAATPRLLALNVHQYDQLPDGRLLAVENHAFVGTWNRLVVIDPVRATKRLVQEGVHEYFLLPGRTEALIDVVSGASGYDIHRAPIPAAAPE
jgi:hypothetical protein